jgi:hypothetical protein
MKFIYLSPQTRLSISVQHVTCAAFDSIRVPQHLMALIDLLVPNERQECPAELSEEVS